MEKIRLSKKFNSLLLTFILGLQMSFGLEAKEIKGSPKVAMLQISPIVADYDGTVKKVIALYLEAVKNGATIVVTPELVLPGYPPADLLSDRPEVLTRSLAAVETMREATKGYNVPLVLGHLDRTPGTHGRKIQNVYTIFADGKPLKRYAKHLLPTYNIFDESRYFEPGTESSVFEWNGVKYGILICEDWWFNDDHDGRLIYKKNPADALYEQGAEVLISVSASPYTKGKRSYRHQVHAEPARRFEAPIIWVNQTGATDNLVSDGSSFVLDANGELVGAMNSFPSKNLDEIGYVTLNGSTKSEIKFEAPQEGVIIPGEDPEMEVLLQALLTGLREYLKRTGHSKVVLGMSGGIDSTVVATIAAMAIGGENVTGISMPSKFSPGHSKSDAAVTAESLGINFFTQPIERIVDDFRTSGDKARAQMRALKGEKFSLLKNLAYKFLPRKLRVKMYGEDSRGSADENLQARARAVTLYDYAGQNPGTLVLTTGCKSELAMGWCTKFGDHAGDFNPIGDLWKTEEIALGKYINRRQAFLGLPDLFPTRIMDKRPSPDLKPNQFTDQTLPPYWILDPLLEDYMVNGFGVEELTLKYGQKLREKEPNRSETWVQEVITRFENAENKRDVAATSTRVSRRAFNQKTRRYPVGRMSERTAAAIKCTDPLLKLGQDVDRRTARP